MKLPEIRLVLKDFSLEIQFLEKIWDYSSYIFLLEGASGGSFLRGLKVLSDNSNISYWNVILLIALYLNSVLFSFAALCVLQFFLVQN